VHINTSEKPVRPAILGTAEGSVAIVIKHTSLVVKKYGTTRILIIENSADGSRDESDGRDVTARWTSTTQPYIKTVLIIILNRQVNSGVVVIASAHTELTVSGIILGRAIIMVSRVPSPTAVYVNIRTVRASVPPVDWTHHFPESLIRDGFVRGICEIAYEFHFYGLCHDIVRNRGAFGPRVSFVSPEIGITV